MKENRECLHHALPTRDRHAFQAQLLAPWQYANTQEVSSSSRLEELAHPVLGKG